MIGDAMEYTVVSRIFHNQMCFEPSEKIFLHGEDAKPLLTCGAIKKSAAPFAGLAAASAQSIKEGE